MTEKRFQIMVNGEEYCEPVGIELKNAFVHSLTGVVDNVEFIEITDKPKLRLVEGGRK